MSIWEKKLNKETDFPDSSAEVMTLCSPTQYRGTCIAVYAQSQSIGTSAENLPLPPDFLAIVLGSYKGQLQNFNHLALFHAQKVIVYCEKVKYVIKKGILFERIAFWSHCVRKRAHRHSLFLDHEFDQNFTQSNNFGERSTYV